MFKVIALCSLVAIASAGLLPEPHVAYEEHAPAQYDFGYSVHDSHTGDIKDQQESRRGDAVQGSYSLVEPDGHRRTVHYSADAHTGFNAVVQREGTAHPQPVAYAHAAPAVVAHAAPVAYAHSAPAVVAHAAPVAYAHSAPQVVAHAAPLATTYSHAAPLAVAHSAPLAVAHQTYAAPQLVSHQYQPAAQYAQYAQPALGHASHGHQVAYSSAHITHHAPAYHH